MPAAAVEESPAALGPPAAAPSREQGSRGQEGARGGGACWGGGIGREEGPLGLWAASRKGAFRGEDAGRAAAGSHRRRRGLSSQGSRWGSGHDGGRSRPENLRGDSGW